MNATRIARLHDQINQVVPIAGVSIGRWADKTTWRVDYMAPPTVTQRQAVQAVISAFDPDTADARSPLAIALDTALIAVPSIDPRIKAVFVEWRKQIT